MSFDIIAKAEALLADLKAHFAPEIKTVQNDFHDVVNAADTYIKANGLQDLYQIALTLVSAAAPGASWIATVASIEAQAVTDGKKIVQGATAIVAAQAQADLIAAGKLLPPVAA
jgi:hypothetical protein